VIKTSVESYFASLRTLEEFGPDSNKSSMSVPSNSEDSIAKRTEDELVDGSQDEQTVSTNNNASQNASKLFFFSFTLYI
jgi:hypothetical protein